MYNQIYELLQTALFGDVAVIAGSSEALWLSGISLALVCFTVCAPLIVLWWAVKRILF